MLVFVAFVVRVVFEATAMLSPISVAVSCPHRTLGLPCVTLCSDMRQINS